MSHLITETESKYAENIRHNLAQVKERRLETAAFIKACEKDISEMDGRKKSTLDLMAQRMQRAKEDEARLKEKIIWLDTMEALVEEASLLDDQIRALVSRRGAIIDITKPDPFKTKWYGMA